MESSSAGWQVGILKESHQVAADVKALTFSLPVWRAHKAGQHYDLRLTAANGYQTQRSYSIASAPEQTDEVEFGIQLLNDGEVSPYVWNLKPGDALEMRGPIGGHFIWEYTMPGPLVVIGGGSGMVPLISMIRHHLFHPTDRQVVFITSAKRLDRVLYRDELQQYHDAGKIKFITTLTDEQPTDWTGYRRRIDQPMLAEILKDVIPHMPMIYLCGPGAFAEAVSTALIQLQVNPHQIRIERFG